MSGFAFASPAIGTARRMKRVDLVFALGLENHVRVTNDVAMMGTAPDVGLLAISNRMLIGTMEGKKDPKKLQSAENSWLWGSNTPVAGEVFEQLYLSF